MDDEGSRIRAIIARSFALIAAITHGRDPEEVRDIAKGHEHWIMTGDHPPDPFTPESKSATDGLFIKMRADKIIKKGKG